jgi:hypothetical protein
LQREFPKISAICLVQSFFALTSINKSSPGSGDFSTRWDGIKPNKGAIRLTTLATIGAATQPPVA